MKMTIGANVITSDFDKAVYMISELAETYFNMEFWEQVNDWMYQLDARGVDTEFTSDIMNVYIFKDKGLYAVTSSSRQEAEIAIGMTL